MNTRRIFAVRSMLSGLIILLSAGTAYAGVCSDVPSHTALKAALVTARSAANGGFNLDMWGTVVNRDGIV